MIDTWGLTHIALAVADLDRASRFYREIFGAVEVYRQATLVQVQMPGTRDVIVFELRGRPQGGASGGTARFGFRLKAPADIGAAARARRAAGGPVKSPGEFWPGEPY